MTSQAPWGSFAASPGAAHAVAHQAPGRAAGQFPARKSSWFSRRTRPTSVFPASFIGFSSYSSVLAAFISSRRSWPQAALISLPSRRRTVALTPRLVSLAWNRRTFSASVAE